MRFSEFMVNWHCSLAVLTQECCVWRILFSCHRFLPKTKESLLGLDSGQFIGFTDERIRVLALMRVDCAGNYDQFAPFSRKLNSITIHECYGTSTQTM